jgi:hypothetical protein
MRTKMSSMSVPPPCRTASRSVGVTTSAGLPTMKC